MLTTEMSDATQPPAAPSGLEEICAFVNTLELPLDRPLRDALATPEQLRSWLAARGFSLKAVSEADWRRTLEVREALRQLLLNNSGEADEAELRAALRLLNAEAERAALRLHFAADGTARLEPASAGLDGFLADLFGSIYAAMHDGTWPRLKACCNDDCQWAFVDHSKNRSGKWCTMAVCGSRMKTRAYRQRQAARGST